MRGLKAVLWKDARLTRRGTGLVALLLPLALLCLLRLGMADTLREAYMAPFPIAVRDLDQTVMSRTLIGQMDRVELFSQVIRVGEQSDQDMLDQGCAAVLTIPKDFFYTMYYMDNSLVEVSLNGEMPLEAFVLRAMFVSMMDMISADQSAGRAVFRFCYGDLSDGETARLWEETSRQIVTDALGRHRVFDRAAETAGLSDTLETRLMGCTLSLICLFFPLAAVKTLSGELSGGVALRYLAAGGRKWVFPASRFLAGLLPALPSLLLVLAAFPQERPGMVLVLALVLYLAGFALQLTLSGLAKGASAAQRWGNLALLCSLTLGGALYPVQLLPAAAQALGELTLPRWAIRGLSVIREGGGVGRLITALAPLWGAAILLLLIWRWRSERGERDPGSRSAPAPSAQMPQTPAGRVPPLFPMAGQKLRAMSGGTGGVAVLLAVAALCGAVAASSLRGEVGTLRLGVAVQDHDPAAMELLERLEEQPGLEVLATDLSSGRRLLAEGRLEGLLRVGAGYSEALEKNGALPIQYWDAAGASSGQAVREMVAGQAAIQRAWLRGLSDAENRLGRALSEGEREALLAQMEEEKAALGPLYRISGLSGGTGREDPFVPQQLSFALLAVILTAFTWAAWTGGADVRRVEGRLAARPGGLWLSYGSDSLALLAVSLLAGVGALLPGGGRGLEWLSLAAYAVCVTGAALALARWGGAGRMDALAPFVALLTCLAGGCFGRLGRVSLATPQGLALRAAEGRPAAFALLLFLGAAFLLLGAPRREGRKKET